MVDDSQQPATEDLVQRIKVQQRESWEQGRHLPIEHFLAAQPSVAEDREAILDLINHEVVLRHGLGQAPKHEEYSDRFPESDLADGLAELFKVHPLLQGLKKLGQKRAATELQTLATESDGSLGSLGRKERSAVSGVFRGQPSVFRNVEDLASYLSTSGLVSSEEVDAAREHLANESEDAEDLLRQLVRDRKLTEFQAQLLAQGKTSGLVLGNYVILRAIGQGGMGQVYMAEHRRMGRMVAVKVLPEELRTHGAVERFQREVRAAARLNHPNVVSSYDADEAEGLHFLVMEYVDGKDLAATVRAEGQLPVERTVDYILQAARGLEYAHRQGVVHRDVKPGNLLLDRDGTVKILDMGLARLAGTGGEDVVTELTQSGMVMGTVDFMAPEQAVGAKHADHRADIYSLGCTLAYLLTGCPVYDGESGVARILAHREQSIPSLRERREDVPEELDGLFQKMLAKRVEDRPQSVSEVISALQALASRYKSDQFAMPTHATGRSATGLDQADSPQRASAVASAVASAGRALITRRRVWIPLSVATVGLIVVAILVVASLRDGDQRPVRPRSPVTGVGSAPPKSTPGPDWSPEGPEWSVPEGAKLITIEALGGEVHYYDQITRLVGTPTGQTIKVNFRVIPDRSAPFYMMENKVWNDLFRVFAKERPELLGNSDWQRGAVANGQFLGVEGDYNGRLPVVGVQLEDAYDFASWLGGHLPTMEQWDKAAGLYGKPIGTERRTVGGPFHVSDGGPPRVAVDREIEGPEAVDEQQTDDIGPFGCRQMAGNGLEFTRSLFSGRTVPVGDPENDHVHLRGRSYDDLEPLLYEDFEKPGSFGTQGYDVSDPHIGFRVVLEIPNPTYASKATSQSR